MKNLCITTIQTQIFKPFEQYTYEHIVQYIDKMPNNSVLAITSKIISIIQNRIVSLEELKISKEDLIKKEADIYLGARNKYNVSLTIKNNFLIPSAGIDESNADEHYILWPIDSYDACKQIWQLLYEKSGHKNFGVIITDSHTTPLRKGVTGICLGFYGIKPLTNYIGEQDIFGRQIKMTQGNNVDAIASAAVLIMGEAAERTPLALITQLDYMEFTHTTQQDIDDIQIAIEDDIYACLLK